MKKITLVLMLAAVSSYAEPGQCGRYQIVTTNQTIGESSIVNSFMIDTVTGRIWNRTKLWDSAEMKSSQQAWIEEIVQMDKNKKWVEMLETLKQTAIAKREQEKTVK